MSYFASKLIEKFRHIQIYRALNLFKKPLISSHDGNLEFNVDIYSITFVSYFELDRDTPRSSIITDDKTQSIENPLLSKFSDTISKQKEEEKED